MSENGVARSRPPQHQLLGGGGLLLIGLACLWLGCRRWVTPSFSDDDAGVATIWLTCAAILITLGAGVAFQTFVNYVEVGPGFVKKHSFLGGTTRIDFGDITAYSYNYSAADPKPCHTLFRSTHDQILTQRLPRRACDISHRLSPSQQSLAILAG